MNIQVSMIYPECIELYNLLPFTMLPATWCINFLRDFFYSSSRWIVKNERGREASVKKNLSEKVVSLRIKAHVGNQELYKWN